MSEAREDQLLKNEALDRFKGRRNLRGLFGNHFFIKKMSLISIMDRIDS
jgi:hypothetical protein